MNIIAVDDEQAMLDELTQAITKAAPGASLAGFTRPLDALGYARARRVDVAFLDVRMEDMDGLELGEKLRAISPSVNLIFVTGYREYTSDAYYLHASGYVDKPVTPTKIRYELEILKSRYADDEQPQKLGPYTFDHVAQRAYCNGVDLLLKPREYAIFSLLAKSPGEYVSPHELYEKVSGQSANDEYRALYSHISRLRKKLGLETASAAAMTEIEQARGKGYRLMVRDKAEP